MVWAVMILCPSDLPDSRQLGDVVAWWSRWTEGFCCGCNLETHSLAEISPRFELFEEGCRGHLCLEFSVQPDIVLMYLAGLQGDMSLHCLLWVCCESRFTFFNTGILDKLQESAVHRQKSKGGTNWLLQLSWAYLLAWLFKISVKWLLGKLAAVGLSAVYNPAVFVKLQTFGHGLCSFTVL